MFFHATCKLSAFETKEVFAFPPSRPLSKALSGRFYEFLRKESQFSLRGDMTAHILADDWNYFDAVIVEANGSQFARLMWSTSA